MTKNHHFQDKITFFGQFRIIGTNYNQIVKILKSNFSEKKALAFLYKLEKETIEMAILRKRLWN